MRKLYFILIICFTLLIIACQRQSVSTENLYQDAESIYSEINENWADGRYINNQQKIEDFKVNYIDNYDKINENDKEIVLLMDKLINSYKLYFVSMGTKGSDVNNYKEKIEESLNELGSKFNK